MVDKNFYQNFENFEGLDLKSTDLTRSPNSFKALTNMQFGEGRSLHLRRGFQRIGQKGEFERIFKYSYSDKDTGETVQELLAINTHLWRLRSTNLVVTNLSTYKLSYLVQLFDTGTPASNTFRFYIYDNLSPLTLVHQITGDSHTWLDLGSGFEVDQAPTTYHSTGTITVADLREALDAHVNLSCPVPSGIPFARVNGNQNNVTTITVDAGHSYAFTSLVGCYLTFWDHYDQVLTARRLISTTGTTLVLDTSEPSVSVKNDQVIGPLSSPAMSVPIIDVMTPGVAGDPINIPFYYWEPIPHPVDNAYYFTAPFYQAHNFPPDNGQHPCFVNQNNSCYIHTSATLNGRDTGVLPGPHEGWPYKYDSQRYYREGVPPVTKGTLTAGAGGLTGAYKYKAQLVHYDNFNIPNFGKLIDLGSITLAAQGTSLTLFTGPVGSRGQIATVNGLQAGVSTITITAGHSIVVGDYLFFTNQAIGGPVIKQVIATTATTIDITPGVVSVNNLQALYHAEHVGFNITGTKVNGNQVNVTSINVFGTTGSPNLVKPGDVVYLYDRKRSVYTTRTLDAITATTISWSVGEDVNVNNNDIITTNNRVIIWRTKAGGNVYYKAAEIPNSGYIDGTVTYLDALADASLGIELIGPYMDPPIGKEQDLPPKTNVACLHQGTRVAAGDISNPNTIYVYSTLNPESVPAASNSFDVPSNVEGAITALASDTDDRLAALKPNAYYDVVGDLDNGIFNIRAVTEGDYGISSHASIAKVNGSLLGVGPLGPVAIQNGAIIDREIYNSKIAPYFWNNTDINFYYIIAFNDYTKRQYHITTSTTFGFALDYENGNKWFDRSYDTTMGPQGGSAVLDGVPFYLTIDGYCFKGLDDLNTAHIYSYADNHLPISREIRFILVGDPEQDKELQWMRLYSMYSVYEAPSSQPGWSMTLQTFRNFGSTQDSLGTFTFSDSAAFRSDIKLRSNKCYAMEFKLSSSALLEAPHITGWTIGIATPAAVEGFKK